MKNTLKTILEAVKIAIGKISWNDLKDRPFYEEVKEEILQEATIELWKEGDSFVKYDIPAFLPLPQLENGETYLVVWDGVEYECVAFAEDGKKPSITIGNDRLWQNSGKDTGEPFAFSSRADENLIAGTSIGNHTYSITHKKSIVHQIQRKYIPDEWDAIIEFASAEIEKDGVYGATLVYGDYDTIYTMVENGQFPKILMTFDYIYGDVFPLVFQVSSVRCCGRDYSMILLYQGLNGTFVRWNADGTFSD